MPRLRRMRLVSIGHDRARFEDVTLKFLDRAGKPTNSVLWLRNGGGKTSLLSLFFAGIKPHQRDFLGKRAEEGIRGIDDYVGSRDQGVVICEWELDAFVADRLGATNAVETFLAQHADEARANAELLAAHKEAAPRLALEPSAPT